jgi:GNAT superfamily N-acetyltransferase
MGAVDGWDNMNKHYSNEHSSAEVVDAKIKGAPGLMQVIRVWTEPKHRHTGSASALMDEICADADAESKVLMLSPKAFGSVDRPPVDTLIEWYGSFGFIIIQENPTLMARMPKSLTATLHAVQGDASEVTYA